ncbi:MAG: branched-chain amino acid ABC transporter permease [Candidatus Rokubacteria bacterium]|nr:branched-chain amino acid ABC transporter permease [Candidatus Rokubacteria bacterium]
MTAFVQCLGFTLSSADILTAQILNSLFYASILFLIASGLTLVYGVMRIVNLAHGNLFALGAYVTGWALGHAVGWVSGPLLFALLLAGAIAVAAVGAVLEPTLLRPLYKRAEEYQLLITFGLLLVLEDMMHWLWGPHPLTSGALPDLVGSATIFGATYPNYNILVIAVGFAAAVGLWAFVYKTRFGVILRATSQNMRMASALGVNVKRVYVQAFTIGCFMAGLGGAVIMPISGAVLGMGIEALILAFVVVVVGGLGSLEGALIGAIIVGLVRTLGIMCFPEIELAVLYLIAAVVLLVRPEGLFGRA